MEPKRKVCVRERGRERGEEYVGYRGEKGERETEREAEAGEVGHKEWIEQ